MSDNEQRDCPPPRPSDLEVREAAARYEAVAATDVNRWLLDLLPEGKGCILDVGAGSGRDAAWLAAQGHDVVAAEPNPTMREEAEKRHPDATFKLLADGLPDLSKTFRTGLSFDLVLMNAVWMLRVAGEGQALGVVRSTFYRRQRSTPRAVGHGAEPDLVLGHHQAVGADEVDVLLSLRRARHLQPLRGRLDGRRPGELGAGRSSHRRDLPQTGRPAPGAHTALRPRRADDEQVHRTTARRPRGHALAEPPPGVRRQPVLRGAVQDPEVSPRLPPASLGASTTSPPPSPSAERSCLGTTPSIAMAGSRCSPRTTSIIIEPRACWTSAGAPFKPPGPVIPNASFEASQNQTPFPQRSGSIHP